ncbi:hypothetical protein TRVL_01644 [Trypanosoma vivax]|uniref:Uncharacterized protein n=1 Tax=Trypanosoma vivax (strain Y486) TaxID=1055687 RepID=G0TUS4_TRYVY|nr:hypothetical protein TRVL_01644 [Trypanosoma vivax]CCC47710.1 hypothetical protein, unlikely [Trypanosoma vivax Y486]
MSKKRKRKVGKKCGGTNVLMCCKGIQCGKTKAKLTRRNVDNEWKAAPQINRKDTSVAKISAVGPWRCQRQQSRARRIHIAPKRQHSHISSHAPTGSHFCQWVFFAYFLCHVG